VTDDESGESTEEEVPVMGRQPSQVGAQVCVFTCHECPARAKLPSPLLPNPRFVNVRVIN